MKFARAGVIAATIAAAMAAAAACSQFPARAQAAPVAKKRAAPEPVDPVVIGGLRFEAPADGKAKGWDRTVASSSRTMRPRAQSSGR